MTQQFFERPILNSPYDYPGRRAPGGRELLTFTGRRYRAEAANESMTKSLSNSGRCRDMQSSECNDVLA